MNPVNVLLVDDDQASLDFMSEFLHRANLSVATAHDGREALAKIAGSPPELIVCDVRMPGMNGLELCRSVKESENDEIPFLFCSGLGDVAERIQGLEIGADDYIVKPFSLDELLLKIRLQLERSRKARSLEDQAERSRTRGVLSGALGEISVMEAARIAGSLGLSDPIEEALLQQASHDPLTGAHNLLSFQEHLGREIGRASQGARVTLAMLDIDHFKGINDDLGHAGGDEALACLTRIVRGELRATDVLYRIGGDEFAILFSDTEPSDASRVLELVFDRLSSAPFTFENKTRQIAASAGLASVQPGDDSASLRARADEALYRAKEEGRGRCVMHASAVPTSR